MLCNLVVHLFILSTSMDSEYVTLLTVPLTSHVTTLWSPKTFFKPNSVTLQQHKSVFTITVINK